MSEKIAVVLELTQEEAEALDSLTMAAIEWQGSGILGERIRAVNMALGVAGISGPNIVLKNRNAWPDDRTWAWAK